jgi:hypothetical protein
MAALGALLLAACADASEPPERIAGDRASSPTRAGPAAGVADPPIARVAAATPEDSAIVRATLRWAHAEGLDTLPIGVAVARIGRRFVGSPYTPGTLDPPGPESLVINLREFDCVTFVESTLALARAAHAAEPGFEAFARELERLRYRGGEREGYASRLHYFSEWLQDNADRGVLELVTPALGGEEDPQPIDFMSTHVEAYWQLADPEALERIREVETRLFARPRVALRESAIASAEAGIREGDVIAATSTLAGLDVAHTGIAVSVGGRIHLMHAPLVGDSVQVSEVPLADRVLRIPTQDGIMVARPREPAAATPR